MSNYGKTNHNFNLADSHCPALAYVSHNYSGSLFYFNQWCDWLLCMLFM